MREKPPSSELSRQSKVYAACVENARVVNFAYNNDERPFLDIALIAAGFVLLGPFRGTVIRNLQYVFVVGCCAATNIHHRLVFEDLENGALPLCLLRVALLLLFTGFCRHRASVERRPGKDQSQQY